MQQGRYILFPFSTRGFFNVIDYGLSTCSFGHQFYNNITCAHNGYPEAQYGKIILLYGICVVQRPKWIYQISTCSLASNFFKCRVRAMIWTLKIDFGTSEHDTRNGIPAVQGSKIDAYSIYLQFRIQFPNPNPVIEPY